MMKEVNIQKLFQEKRYTEIIFVLDYKVPEKQKNSGLLNLLGVCRLLKGQPNKKEYLEAISDFKKAFLKEKRTQHSTEAFKNFINVSVDLYNCENSVENHEKASEFFKEILFFYGEDKDFFSKDESIMISLARVQTRLVNIDKVREYYAELIKNKFYNPQTICSLIYNNCFSNDWRQKDFLDHGRLLSKNLKLYEIEKLKPFNKNKKVKIGFISSDIQARHSIVYFLKTITDNYDKEKFEIYLYSNNRKSLEDENIRFIKSSINGNRDIYRSNNLDIINTIRKDKIDILIDLMGVTSAQKLEILKNRSAPIQIVWCGFCNTTGIEEVDYIISDPNLIYETELDLYQEKIIFLPKIWNCHSGIDIKRTFNEAPSLKKESITFGSLNNFNKINTTVIETWSKILKEVKNSKLILKSSTSKVIDSLIYKFKKNGVLDSVEFINTSLNFEDHMSIYNRIDVALDTFPYNGVTTSFEAIWMGVPVITMKGYNFNSRCGESINKNLNMEYLIAENQSDYVAKAKELSQNKNKLFNVRKEIFDQAITSPLFDVKSFSNDFFKSMLLIYNK